MAGGSRWHRQGLRQRPRGRPAQSPDLFHMVLVCLATTWPQRLNAGSSCLPRRGFSHCPNEPMSFLCSCFPSARTVPTKAGSQTPYQTLLRMHNPERHLEANSSWKNPASYLTPVHTGSAQAGPGFTADLQRDERLFRPHIPYLPVQGVQRAAAGTPLCTRVSPDSVLCPISCFCPLCPLLSLRVTFQLPPSTSKTKCPFIKNLVLRGIFPVTVSASTSTNSTASNWGLRPAVPVCLTPPHPTQALLTEQKQGPVFTALTPLPSLAGCLRPGLRGPVLLLPFLLFPVVCLTPLPGLVTVGGP